MTSDLLRPLVYAIKAAEYVEQTQSPVDRVSEYLQQFQGWLKRADSQLNSYGTEMPSPGQAAVAPIVSNTRTQKTVPVKPVDERLLPRYEMPKKSPEEEAAYNKYLEDSENKRKQRLAAGMGGKKNDWSIDTDMQLPGLGVDMDAWRKKEKEKSEARLKQYAANPNSIPAEHRVGAGNAKPTAPTTQQVWQTEQTVTPRQQPEYQVPLTGGNYTTPQSRGLTSTQPSRAYPSESGLTEQGNPTTHRAGDLPLQYNPEFTRNQTRPEYVTGMQTPTGYSPNVGGYIAKPQETTRPYLGFGGVTPPQPEMSQTATPRPPAPTQQVQSTPRPPAPKPTAQKPPSPGPGVTKKSASFNLLTRLTDIPNLLGVSKAADLSIGQPKKPSTFRPAFRPAPAPVTNKSAPVYGQQQPTPVPQPQRPTAGFRGPAAVNPQPPNAQLQPQQPAQQTMDIKSNPQQTPQPPADTRITPNSAVINDGNSTIVYGNQSADQQNSNETKPEAPGNKPPPPPPKTNVSGDGNAEEKPEPWWWSAIKDSPWLNPPSEPNRPTVQSGVATNTTPSTAAEAPKPETAPAESKPQAPAVSQEDTNNYAAVGVKDPAQLQWYKQNGIDPQTLKSFAEKGFSTQQMMFAKQLGMSADELKRFHDNGYTNPQQIAAMRTGIGGRRPGVINPEAARIWQNSRPAARSRTVQGHSAMWEQTGKQREAESNRQGMGGSETAPSYNSLPEHHRAEINQAVAMVGRTPETRGMSIDEALAEKKRVRKKKYDELIAREYKQQQPQPQPAANAA
jgi:hypothetical protein